MTREPRTEVRTEMRGFIEENFLYLQPDVELADGDDLLAARDRSTRSGSSSWSRRSRRATAITVEDVEITEENFGSIDAIVALRAGASAAA